VRRTVVFIALAAAGFALTACGSTPSASPPTTVAAPVTTYSVAEIQWSDTFARVKNGEVPKVIEAAAAEDNFATDDDCTALMADITTWRALPVYPGFPADGLGLLHQAWDDITTGCTDMTEDTVTADSVRQGEALVVSAQRLLQAT
jgi:hypothetical protein